VDDNFEADLWPLRGGGGDLYMPVFVQSMEGPQGVCV
jgi:hypothetical protein